LALYELRTYSLYVGKLGGARALPERRLARGRHADNKLVGYLIGDVGAMNQIVHLWKFADDADRRRFWEAVFADGAFMAFASKLRPLIQSQENKLLLAAPWGPHP
jgi:hypothetical protein